MAVPPRPSRLRPDWLLRGLLLTSGLLATALAGCELIADFDGDDLPGTTTPVRPLPMLDGAVPLTPDGSIRDAALVTDRPDADAASPDASVATASAMDAGG